MSSDPKETKLPTLESAITGTDESKPANTLEMCQIIYYDFTLK